MKRSISVLLALKFLLVCLVGCAGNADNEVLDSTVADTRAEDSTVSTTDDTTPDTTDKTENDPKDEYEPVNMWTYSTKNGIKVRDLVIETEKGGEELEIMMMTDLHLSWVNDTDLADPVIADTYKSRTWGKNGAHWSNAERCLNFAKDADQIVLTGDIYDYITSETVKRVEENIFAKYDNLMACLGNHEGVKAMGEEKTWTEDTVKERMEFLSGVWKNNVYYSSKVLGDKVMLIQMDNAVTGKFWDCQVEPFEADLKRARENGYAVLIFYHVPIATYNPRFYNTKALYVGDRQYFNFATEGATKYGQTADAKICSLIVNNGDIIKGTFCGHFHSDFYSEIIATCPSGEEVLIPQYVLTGTPYDNGHVLRITVK